MTNSIKDFGEINNFNKVKMPSDTNQELSSYANLSFNCGKEGFNNGSGA